MPTTYIKQLLLLFLITLLILTLVSCQVSSVLKSLDIVISAAELVLPILTSTVGIPPAVTVAILNYLKLLDEFILRATTIINNPTSTPVDKTTQIAKASATISNGCVNCLSPTIPQSIVTTIHAVEDATNKFLFNFGVGKLATSPNINVVKVGTPDYKLSRSDKSKLTKIVNRTEKHLGEVTRLQNNLVGNKEVRKP